MKTKLLLMLIVVAALCAVLYVPSARMTSTPAYAADPAATARGVTLDGRQAGEVVVGDQVVIRIRTSAGGLTPEQRAQTVAQRINGVVGTSSAGSIAMRRVGGQYAVMAGQTLLVTAGPAEAQMNGMTRAGLANFWALRLSNALGVNPADPTPTAQKIVPIISIGSGTRVGGALVSGASSRLDEVVAVAQIEGRFGNAVRVRALVPVSTENVVSNIKRVPQTAVIGLVDIKL